MLKLLFKPNLNFLYKKGLVFAAGDNVSGRFTVNVPSAPVHANHTIPGVSESRVVDPPDDPPTTSPFV